MTTTGLLALITLLAAALYLFYGIILAYHWFRFSASWTISILSVGAYIISGLYLLSIMAFATLTV